MKIKIGDKVRIDKKKCKINSNVSYIDVGDIIPSWYSENIYTVINIDKNNEIVELDRNLPKINKNRIHINYLKLLNVERKNKLLKLNSLYIE